MRIVHFSDIHVGCGTRDFSALRDKRVFGLLNYLLRRRRQFDLTLIDAALQKCRMLQPEVVICTGDITSTGSPEEFTVARERLSPFYAEDAPWVFLYVPGNHDAYVRRPACRQALATTSEILLSGRWQAGEGAYEFIYKNVHFLLVNEAVPTPVWLSTGRLSAGDLERLRCWGNAPRAAGEKRILVGHFPLRDARGRRLGARRRLVNDIQVHALFAGGGFDVALCGHEHTPFVRWESDGRFEACAGSLTAAACLNLVEYVPERQRFFQSWVSLRPKGLGAGLSPRPLCGRGHLAYLLRFPAGLAGRERDSMTRR